MKNILMKFSQLALVALLMCMAVASAVSGEAEGQTVTFGLAVNDYPDHKDYSQSQNLPFAYVNAYIMKLDNDGKAFKVYNFKTLQTNIKGDAQLQVLPGEMYYFEGFKTVEEAQTGAKNKQAVSWITPAYKNFNDGSGKLCQTDYTNIGNYLKNDKNYACANKLSTPYLKTKTEPVVPTPPTPKNDLAITGLEFSDKAFKANVCNWGNTAVSGFKIKFEANGKENVLTFAPALSAGKCMSLYSWEYGYFGVTGKNFDVKATLDPADEIAESDESNNLYELKASKEELPPTIASSEMEYIIYPRSEDKSARGDVAKYTYEDKEKQWELAYVKPAELTEVFVVGPEENAFGQKYKAEMPLKVGETALFLAFYPKSEIPKILAPEEIPASMKVVLTAQVIDGKVYGCKISKSCDTKYASHSLEMLWYENGKVYTIYQKPELKQMEDLFSGEGSEAQVLPVIPQPTLPQEVEDQPMLPAYDESKKTDGGKKADESKPLPAYDETKWTPKQKNGCDNGCEFGGKCIPVGTKIKDRDAAEFCNWNGQMLSQMAEGEYCQNDYECLSNSCANSKCLDLEKKLEEQQNLLEKILAWLESVFG